MTSKLRSAYGNGDHQERIDFGVDGLMRTETVTAMFGETPLQAIYNRWRDRRQNGFVKENDIATDALPGHSIYKIDVRDENPENYLYRILWPQKAKSSRYASHLDLIQDTAVVEHPIKAMRVDMMIEYNDCKSRGEPAAHRITHNFGGFMRDYCRLLLPVCDARGNVTTLVGVSRHLEVPSE